MQYRLFGRLGWKVSEIGYGMWGVAGWTGRDDAESRASLQQAVELGCNFFDTALAYGEGHSEKLLGELVRNNPDRGLIVASKALLDENPNPTETEIRYWLAGNLCRCTGYDKIIRAVQDAGAVMRGEAS